MRMQLHLKLQHDPTIASGEEEQDKPSQQDSGYLHSPCSLSRERAAAWLYTTGTPPGVTIVCSPYKITPIHWLIA